MKELFLLRGLPGSGKSTLAKMICSQHVEADMFFIQDGEYKFDASKIKDAHKFCQDTVETYMKDSLINDQFYREIAVANTFTQEWEFQPYFELAEKYGYKTFSIVVENRHGGTNVHNVPEDKIEQMKKRFSIKL
jgi:predicted kinase